MTFPGVPGFENAVEIGRGGFAGVYRAHQTAFDRTVAIKVLDPRGLSDKLLHDFERECRAVGGLWWHPHIVTVYQSGLTTDGRPYLVMDYMPGGSFGARVERAGPLPWDEVATIGVKIAGALEAAHRAGRLHRDVKPDNILVTGFGEPVLADFGIAWVTGSTQTASGTVTASLAHAAPEILQGGPAAPVTDVYSLGSTLYVLLAGKEAFLEATDESIAPLMYRVVNAPVPDLRLSGVPDAMAAVVERAMAKDALERYQTAADVGRALQEVQIGAAMAPAPMIVAPGTIEAPAGTVAAPPAGGDGTVRVPPPEHPPVASAEGATPFPGAPPPPPPPPPGQEPTRVRVRRSRGRSFALAAGVPVLLLVALVGVLVTVSRPSQSGNIAAGTTVRSSPTSTTLPGNAAAPTTTRPAPATGAPTSLPSQGPPSTTAAIRFTVATCADTSGSVSGPAGPKPQYPAPPDPMLEPGQTYTAVMETTKGTVTIALDPVAAPQGVNSFVFLARCGFYDGLPLHRIARDFVIQDGDPTGSGTGGPGYTLPEEPPASPGYPVGSFALGSTSRPHTTGSQWFIVTGAQAASLPNNYTRLGTVTSGLDVAQAISALPIAGGGTDGPPAEPVVVTKVTITQG